LSLRQGVLAALAAAALCACTEGPDAQPVAAGPQIRVAAQPVPFAPENPGRARDGHFTYAGGLALTSPDTGRLHGMSDLKVWPDGRMLAVGDEGDLLEGRLVLDGAGRLAGVDDTRLTQLQGADGRPLLAHGKKEADSEGIAELANGDRLVSLECDDRVLLYPKDGGPPRRVASPAVSFPYNKGMEAIDVDPANGPDAYVVGGEESGQTWVCHLDGGCAESTRVAKPRDAGLSAVAVLPGGGRAYLVRSFSLVRLFTVKLVITGADGSVLDELDLAPPLTVDNFEGLAALPRTDGSIRFYLISDDNFSRFQRTLLVGFDWTPQSRREP
jgi:hypothetical protein